MISSQTGRNLLVGIALLAGYIAGYFMGKPDIEGPHPRAIYSGHHEDRLATQSREIDSESPIERSDDNPGGRDDSADNGTIPLPRTAAGIVFQDVFFTDTMQIAPGYKGLLDLSDAEKSSVEAIVRKYIREMGVIDAKNSKLVHDEQGEYYVLEPFADSSGIRKRFQDEILTALGQDRRRAETVANVLEYSKALSGFGAARREVYVRDYTIEGQSYTSVEVSTLLDPARQLSRRYNVGTAGEFVAERYPFLRQNP